MSIAWFPPSSPRAPRGAAPVGALADLPALEQGAVLVMRHWRSDPGARRAVAEDFSLALGAARGQTAVEALDHLLHLFQHHGRRPLMHHALACACLGGDESLFAQMIAAATGGDTEDAMALSLTLLPAAPAFEAVRTAERLGLALLAMIRNLHAAPGFPASGARH